MQIQRHYQTLTFVQADWKQTFQQWQKTTCMKIFLCISIGLFAIFTTLFIGTFYLVPLAWIPIGVLISTIPLFIWGFFAGITLAGLLHGPERAPGCFSIYRCLWSFFFGCAFCGRCNPQSVQNYRSPELEELLIDLSYQETKIEGFQMPQYLVQVEKSIQHLQIWNQDLLIQWPTLLPFLPRELCQIILQYLIQ